MSVQLYTTNKHGEFRGRELFPGESLAGTNTLIKSDHPTNSGFLGFGVAITDSSCYNLSLMEPADRHALLEMLYSEKGLGFSVGRLTIGSSDYSAAPYSYDEVKDDTQLTHFSIERDKAYILPILQEILAINPELRLLASPWSPPAWMKTGGSLGGGYMREKYLACYADYILKFIQGYEDEGIPIYAVTPQNEPQTAQNGHMPACIWHPDHEAAFIEILREKMNQSGLHTKIWCHDHNFYDAVGRVDWYLSEYPALSKACDGVAFHYYEGFIEQTTFLKEKYPALSLHFTEGGPRLYDHYDTDWCKWGLMMIKALNNRYSSFTGWNLMLDETGGPNVGPFYCGGLVTRNTTDGALTFSGQYKAFRHFSAVRESSEIHPLSVLDTGKGLFGFPNADRFDAEGCVVENADGETTLILVNPTDHKLQLQYTHKGQLYYIELLPETLATVVFTD